MDELITVHRGVNSTCGRGCECNGMKIAGGEGWVGIQGFEGPSDEMWFVGQGSVWQLVGLRSMPTNMSDSRKEVLKISPISKTSSLVAKFLLRRKRPNITECGCMDCTLKSGNIPA